MNVKLHNFLVFVFELLLDGLKSFTKLGFEQWGIKNHICDVTPAACFVLGVFIRFDDTDNVLEIVSLGEELTI
jgi:hypothetical protein